MVDYSTCCNAVGLDRRLDGYSTAIMWIRVRITCTTPLIPAPVALHQMFPAISLPQMTSATAIIMELRCP